MTAGGPMDRTGVGERLGVGDRGEPLNDDDTGAGGEGFPVPSDDNPTGESGRTGDEAGDEANMAQDDSTTPFLPQRDEGGRP